MDKNLFNVFTIMRFSRLKFFMMTKYRLKKYESIFSVDYENNLFLFRFCFQLEFSNITIGKKILDAINLFRSKKFEFYFVPDKI